MVKIALVGTGRLGTEIAHAILQQKQHSLIVLSRKPRPDLTNLGIIVSIIDYSKPETIVSALHGVHTVISIVFAYDPPSFLSSQLTLVQAAKEAGVQRFAPSEFAVAKAANKSINLYHPKEEIWRAVVESGMQYTAFRPGMYMNYLAFGSPKPGVAEKAFNAAPNMAFGLNIGEGKADIPGTGNEKFNFTTTKDIAGFVAAALDTEWTEESGMAGSVVTFNELVSIAETVTGKKIKVTYHSIDEMEKRAQEEPSQAMMMKMFIAFANGLGYVEPTLNKTTQYKPVTAEEYIREWWA